MRVPGLCVRQNPLIRRFAAPSPGGRRVDVGFCNSPALPPHDVMGDGRLSGPEIAFFAFNRTKLTKWVRSARTTEPIAPATLARASTSDPFGFVRRFDLMRSRNPSVASFRKIVRHTSSRSTRPRFPERSQRLRFANSLRGNLPSQIHFGFVSRGTWLRFGKRVLTSIARRNRLRRLQPTNFQRTK